MTEEPQSFKPRFTPEQVKDTLCGFCGKGRDEVSQLIVGLKFDVAICNECTGWAWEIVSRTEVYAP